MLFAAALLLASTLHAGPEFPVSAPVRDKQPYVQQLEDVAGGADIALAVWREGALLRGARIDRDGTALDATPLLIAYAPWEGARVARGTANWLVVSRGPDHVAATIVEEDGTVRAPIRFDVTSPTIAVAFNGSEYLVTWGDASGSIFAARISASGVVLQSAILLGQLLGLHDLFPAAGGGFTLIAQQAEVYAIRLDAQAHEVSRRTLLPTILWYDPVFGLDAAGHVVTGWRDEADVAHIQREGADAVAVDANRIAGFVTLGGTTYAMARRGEDLAFVQLTGATVRELGGPVERARAVAFGNRVLLVTSYTDVFRTLLDASLQTIAPKQLVYGEPALQYGPAIARAGDATLIAWVESDGVRSHVRARSGEGEPFEIGEGGGVAVATDGHDFLVTWRDNLLQSYRIVSHDGVLQGGGTIGSWTTGGSCATWNGEAYVIGYLVVPGFPRELPRPAYAQRVTRDGTASGEPVLLKPSLPLISVACASTAETTLFAFDGAQQISGATLTRGGTLLTFDIGTGTAPSVAAHGDGFLAGWTGQEGSFWTRISEAGTVEPARPIEANTIRVAPGRLMYGTDPLRVRTLDGPEVVIASDAYEPAFAGGTLVYTRNTDILPQPRWRVFFRNLDETSGRRRVTRH